MGIINFISEIAAIKNLFGSSNKDARQVVFYSESSIYYLYFEGLIDYLLSNSDIRISYISSDPQDPVFKLQSERFRVFYISNLMLAFVTIFLDSKILLLTMPDLDKHHIKRSTKSVNHIYLFHAILSTHMIYKQGAFNNYDTIFCVGPHHVEEIRRTEEFYELEPKELVEVGYHWLEKLSANHRAYLELQENNPDTKPQILIAPTWGEGNIIESCAKELITPLIEAGYRVILRPHPEIIKSNKSTVDAISEIYKGELLFSLETKLTTISSFHESEILITDWSGIAFEYAFGTERPVIFINTPMKVNNINYKQIGIDPLEVKLRKKIGYTLEISEIASISSVAEILIENKDLYRDKIIKLRDYYIFNWGRSAEIAGNYILNMLNG